MAILILGGGDDEHATHILCQLRERGADAEFFDTRTFPVDMTIAFDPVRGAGRIALATGRKLDFQEIQSVYWRAYHGIADPGLPDPQQSFIAANDSRSLIESLFLLIPARWVNDWNAYRLHQTKPAQLAAVAALGVPIPATLLGNDPEAVREFAARYPRSIFKPVQGGAHARSLTAAHLSDDNLRHLRYAPVTVQEQVSGTNVRAFVAGEGVLACEIQTEALDYRDDPDCRIAMHALPRNLENDCRRIADALGLLWTGIDFRLTPEGRYIFLEANPSPMFLEFERRSGLPLTESLLDLIAP